MSIFSKPKMFLTGSVLLPTLLAPLRKHHDLQFTVQEGESRHWFFKNPKAAVQLVVTSERPRVIAAFPAGNSGVGLWFDGSADLKLLGAEAGEKGTSEKVAFSIRSDQKELFLSRAALDSLRILRNAPPESEVKAIRANYARTHGIPAEGTVNARVRVHEESRWTTLEFERKDFGAREPYRARLIFPSGTRVQQAPGGWRISHPDAPLSFDAEFSVPFKAMDPLSAREIFTSEALHAIQKNRNPNMRQAVMNLEFLAFKEKFLAGGWQYFTYFGRDTALTLLMLGEILTPEAYEAGLQSLMDRLSDQGEVAHEEDVGSLNEIHQIARGERPDPNGKPFLDYKMVDSDYLLPILFARYLEKVSPARAELFLARKNLRNETNRESLLLNFQHVIDSARPFAQSGNWRDLIRLKPGQAVGNWRDSGIGLGGGIYPADVNLWLLPAALDALKEAGPYFVRKLPGPIELDALRHAWKKAEPYFQVTLSTDEARRRVDAYMNGALSPVERNYFLKQKTPDGVTLAEFLAGKTPEALRKGFTFPALSLDSAGKPVAVLHSDPVFALFLQRLSSGEVKKILPIFSLPYPLGLKTEVGLLVANPATSTNPTHWKTLNADAYHGTVVWVWPQSMLRMGLARQKHWHLNDWKLCVEMGQLKKHYREVEKKLGPLALSELYTFWVRKGKLEAIQYGLRPESQHLESNPVQFWSTVLPAVELAELSDFSCRGSVPGK